MYSSFILSTVQCTGLFNKSACPIVYTKPLLLRSHFNLFLSFGASGINLKGSRRNQGNVFLVAVLRMDIGEDDKPGLEAVKSDEEVWPYMGAFEPDE